MNKDRQHFNTGAGGLIFRFFNTNNYQNEKRLIQHRGSQPGVT